MFNETDRDRVVRQGRTALTNLKKDKNWTWWLQVGEAILVGREECKVECGLANTNLPPGHWGSAYNSAMGDWLAREKLEFDKGDRSRLFDVMDNLPAIEAWRKTLTMHERLKLNHPSSVLRKWKAATKVPEPKEDKPTLRDSVATLSEDVLVRDAKIARLMAYIEELEAALANANAELARARALTD